MAHVIGGEHSLKRLAVFYSGFRVDVRALLKNSKLYESNEIVVKRSPQIIEKFQSKFLKKNIIPDFQVLNGFCSSSNNLT